MFNLFTVLSLLLFYLQVLCGSHTAVPIIDKKLSIDRVYTLSMAQWNLTISMVTLVVNFEQKFKLPDNIGIRGRTSDSWVFQLSRCHLIFFSIVSTLSTNLNIRLLSKLPLVAIRCGIRNVLPFFLAVFQVYRYSKLFFYGKPVILALILPVYRYERYAVGHPNQKYILVEVILLILGSSTFQTFYETSFKRGVHLGRC